MEVEGRELEVEAAAGQEEEAEGWSSEEAEGG